MTKPPIGWQGYYATNNAVPYKNTWNRCRVVGYDGDLVIIKTSESRYRGVSMGGFKFFDRKSGVK